MNKIETIFYKAMVAALKDKSLLITNFFEIKPQQVIGIYNVDFLINEKFVVEVDGHDYHKTKEQREHDYKRDRYLQKKGYTVIRYMGTEVFLDAAEYAKEVVSMIDQIMSDHDYEEMKLLDMFGVLCKKH